jgi:hypothetical protein
VGEEAALVGGVRAADGGRRVGAGHMFALSVKLNMGVGTGGIRFTL